MLNSTRRRFLQATAAASLGWSKLKSFAGINASPVPLPANAAGAPARLFPADLKDSAWNEFGAAGFAKPVSGILYRTKAISYFSAYMDRPKPASGMPLGGVDTGGLYLEPSGVWGYSSIFGAITPAGGPVNTPYLGLHVGGTTWVMTTGQTKNYAGNSRPSMGINLRLLNCGMCENSEYWGHYPVADVEYKNGAPVQVGVRAWSPLIPGDVKASNTPGAVFEVHMRNTSDKAQTGTLAFNFPGFAEHATKDYVVGWPDLSAKPVMPPPQIERHSMPAGLAGSWVEDKAWGMSYLVAALDETKVRIGGALNTDGLRWEAIPKELPKIDAKDDGGSSVAVDFNLEAGAEKVVRFVLAWYLPEWEGNGHPGTGGERILTEAPGAVRVLSTTGKRFTHMYATRYANAGEVAQYLAKNHVSLLKRILAWQAVVYEDKSIPGFLADTLINALYYMAPCSMWAQAKDPIGSWCRPEDGVFALEEAPRSCPHVTTLSNYAMGGPTIPFFFPELGVSALRAYRAAQKENGDLPQLLGRWADVANVMAYDYQEVIVGPCYVMAVYTHWKATGDDAFMKDFYPSVKKALQYSFTQRPDLGDSQIIAMPPFRPGTWNDSEWFEDRSMIGYVAHPGGLRIAAAEMLKDWARIQHDDETVKWLDRLIAAGKDALEKYMWKGDHYLIYNDTKTGKTFDALFAPMLNGHFFARFNGVRPPFPKERVETTLAVQRDKLGKISSLGMPPIYANPDGTPWGSDATGYLTGRYIYTNHQTLWNSINFIYEGQREYGLELMRKNLEISYCKWGYIWDGTNCCSGAGDTGEVNYGWDYWFNWSIWAAPAALNGTDIGAMARPGGLVHRMKEAAKA
jgi:uncharacterized protein (DUF608 family)